MKHYKISVVGKVQGVYFRKSTVEVANSLGIKGFVRNEENGSVYIDAEGREESISSLIEWCKKGPPRAKVESVDFAEGHPNQFSSFVIV